MIYKETFADGFTQSEIGTLDECAFKWNMRYNYRFQPDGYYRLPFMFGTAWHDVMETLFRDKKVKVPVLAFPENAVITEGDQDKLTTLQFMLDGMSKAYAQYYKDEIKNFKSLFIEEVVEVNYKYNGVIIPLKGKIDRMDHLGTLFDSKSTSMLRNDILAKWDLKFQFMFYCWLIVQKHGLKKVRKFTVDAVKKPQIRINKGEPPIAFGRRVESALLCKPVDYFYRSTIAVTAESMEHFEKEILEPKLERFLLMQDNPELRMWENKNTDACHHFGETCPFFPVCAEGAKPENIYNVLKLKHTEYRNEE